MLLQRALQLEAALTSPVRLMQQTSLPAQSLFVVQPSTAPLQSWFRAMQWSPPKPAQQLCVLASHTSAPQLMGVNGGVPPAPAVGLPPKPAPPKPVPPIALPPIAVAPAIGPLPPTTPV